ncbi:MAG: tetratricopeptide repeat protein [Candidatus Melainabacteria bacterium]|nr:tetratricopeptide repeat protein [Candidatus Melainabacteria bacterium]
MTRADVVKASLIVLALSTPWATSGSNAAEHSAFFDNGLGTISPAPSDRHQSAFERGEAEMSHRDYDGAISSFTEVLGFNMNNTAAYFKRGQCYYQQKKYPEALSDFEYMLKANPQDTQALLWSGTAQAKLGHEQKAIELYVQAMRVDPQLVVQYQKGQAQSGQKVEPVNPRNQGAVSAYERAVAQYLVEHPSADVGNSAVVAPSNVIKSDIAPSGSEPDSTMSDPELKIEQLDAAIHDDPSNASLRFRRGQVNKRLGRFDKALADFGEAINLDPMKSRFYLARARLYHEQNQPELSLADVKKAQSVDPTVPNRVNFDEDKTH